MELHVSVFLSVEETRFRLKLTKLVPQPQLIDWTGTEWHFCVRVPSQAHTTYIGRYCRYASLYLDLDHRLN